MRLGYLGRADVAALVFLVALVSAPIAARAELGLRVGGAADLIYQAGAGYFWIYGGRIHGITDFAPAEAHVMVSWWLSPSVLSLDLEVAEELYLNAPSGSPTRSGTTLRPGIRVEPPMIPLYLRAAFPIHVETPEQPQTTIGVSGGVLRVPSVDRSRRGALEVLVVSQVNGAPRQS